MRALFVSDLHLDPERPHITELFLAFLHDEARQVPDLYIAGDLFETFIGDDDDADLPCSVADALKAVAAAGTRIGFIRGNRDFLVGRDYARAAGLDILPDPCVITLAGEPTLLLHGDLLCWDDTAYLAVRRQVRDPAWQQALLSRALVERRAFAQAARQSSAAHQQSMSSLDIGDATAPAIDDMFRRYGVRRMIHGHTHRPAIHDLVVDGVPRQRIVLGDWYQQGSVLRVHDDGRCELAGLRLAA
ncbi:UDP-2,3-diacylglucosamine diphosphatase [Xanthomonadaceae bacterium JHOS43]|nr:UDP-2,3-diacylglucosamine diphosphatase [Xanthomonadaceae bacterium JHOS43]MCX7563749.1 UDP-2,3-diacylglucosamine diphosphatase [Xanthomonadaceae bacterium XH05]